MMEYTKKIDPPHLLAREKFCKDLISQAGSAYSSWRNKKIIHTQYYVSNDTSLTYGVVKRAGEKAWSDLNQYIHSYSELYRVHLNSPLTPRQAKRQAKSLMKRFECPGGDQPQFEEAFEICMDYLIDNSHSPDLEYYLSDSSDEGDDLAAAPTTVAELSSCSLSSLTGCIPDYDDEPNVEDQLYEHGFFVDNRVLDEDSPGAFITPELMPVHELCHAFDNVSFSHRRSKGKHVTFFDRVETDTIQLDHQKSLQLDMIEM